MKRFIVRAVCASSVAAVALVSLYTVAQQSDGWLTGASDRDEQMVLIENYLRGFSTSMRETGDRYVIMHQAIVDENYPLASYHWGKIREAVELGIIKRPGRAENAVNMFLGEPWQRLSEALESENHESIVEHFNVARSMCMACHAAEGVPWMNDQAMFRDTAL